MIIIIGFEAGGDLVQTQDPIFCINSESQQSVEKKIKCLAPGNDTS